MLAADPVDQFSAWLADAAAAGLPEPNAMVLSTVSAAGRPRSRSVLLKEHGPAGFVFYTNRTSAKAQDLAANGHASALFPWYALQRQVIVHGSVTAMSQADSEPYFHSRPHGSQLGAWASRQSSVIASRAEIEDAYARLEQRWPEGTTVPMPDFWGGYRLVPTWWSSGRAGSTGCTTGCVTAVMERTGSWNACRPDLGSPAMSPPANTIG